MKRKNLTSLALHKDAISNLTVKKIDSIKGGGLPTRVGQVSCAPLFCDTK